MYNIVTAQFFHVLYFEMPSCRLNRDRQIEQFSRSLNKTTNQGRGTVRGKRRFRPSDARRSWDRFTIVRGEMRQRQNHKSSAWELEECPLCKKPTPPSTTGQIHHGILSLSALKVLGVAIGGGKPLSLLHLVLRLVLELYPTIPSGWGTLNGAV